MSRGKDAKDVDWTQIAGANDDDEDEDVIEKPKPIKIDVAEVLNRVRKPGKKISLKPKGSKNSKRFELPILYLNLNLFAYIAARPPQIFCYMTSWSRKRPSAGRYAPEDIDANLCTHIIYAFATLKDHILTEADDKDPDIYDRVIALRDKNPDLKVSFFSKPCCKFLFNYFF